MRRCKVDNHHERRKRREQARDIYRADREDKRARDKDRDARKRELREAR